MELTEFVDFVRTGKKENPPYLYKVKLEEDHFFYDYANRLTTTPVDVKFESLLPADSLPLLRREYRAYSLLETYLYQRGLWKGNPYIPGHFYVRPGEPVRYGPFRRNADTIYIIGKAPSETELRTGLNYSGDFGQALFEVLQQHLPEHYFDNLYLSNLSRIPVKGRLDRTSHDFYPLIYNELFILRPKWILCLGSDALKFFTRRSLQSVIDNPEFKKYSPPGEDLFMTMICAAPLAALHTYADYLEFCNSIRWFCERIQNKQVGIDPIVEYDVIATAAELEALVHKLVDKKARLAVDLEWQGAFPTQPGSYVRCISLYDGERAYIIKICDKGGIKCFDNMARLKDLMNLLFSANVQVVGHNFMADLPWLHSLGIRVRKPFVPETKPYEEALAIFDTIFMYHSVDETGKFDLESAARLWLGAKGWSEGLKADGGYGNVEDAILFPYTAKDVYYTYELFSALVPHLYRDRFGNDCWDMYIRTMRTVPAYLEMHETGIHVDTVKAAQMQKAYQRRSNELVEELRALVRWPSLNIRSYKQVSELLYGDRFTSKPSRPLGAITFNLEPVKTTKGEEWDEEETDNTPSTDFESCELLIQQDPRVKYIRDIRALDQVLKTYLSDSGFLSHVYGDGKVHASFYPLKETRRCSTARPNIQNLANEAREALYQQILGDSYCGAIRSLLVPDEGHVFLETDYSGAELLAIAVAANDKTFIEDYLRSLTDETFDIHSNIACWAFRLDCAPNKKALEEAGKKHLRLAAKRIIFGLNYGRGVHSCWLQLKADGMDLTEEDVARIVDTIYNRYSRVPALQKEVEARLDAVGWIANCFGSYRRFFKSKNQEIVAKNFREAINFLCQSTVADAVACALYHLMMHSDKNRLGYKILNNMHDAILLQVPKNQLEEVKYVVQECMIDKVSIRHCDLSGIPQDSTEYRFGSEMKIVGA